MTFQNITLPLPAGTINHGNQSILCIPSKWYHIGVFILANYVAHAATVRPFPGQKLKFSLVDMLVALFFPSSGALRGLVQIKRCVVFERDPLRRATKAGALCQVVRNYRWVPQSGDEVRGVTFEPLSNRRDNNYEQTCVETVDGETR